ncbi:MAG: hypothetical protein WD187_03205 [Candidatus Woykebacteria bacterium]
MLFVWQPWDSSTHVHTQPVEADLIEYRICDTVLEASPTQTESGGYSRVGLFFLHPSGPTPQMEIDIEKTVQGAEGSEKLKSRVVLDGQGNLVQDQREVAAAAANAQIAEILATKRQEPLDPAKAPWPYNDFGQQPEMWWGQEGGYFKYRVPDPGTGINTITDATLGFLRVENCRSWMEVRASEDGSYTVEQGQKDGGRPGEVHPDDGAAFQTFLESLTVRGEQ